MVPLKALIICPWFGPLPPWMPQYRRNIRWFSNHGFDMLIDTDLDGFKERVRHRLGVHCPIEPGTGKIHDYRACLAELYAEEVARYGWWGHTDFDCVYGRIERFYTPELLAELDILSDCPNYIAGPWTMYRNQPEVNGVFREFDAWKEILALPETTGWVEQEFTRLVDSSSLRVRYHFRHAYSDDNFLKRQGRALIHFGTEIPFFHFRYRKRWPL